MTGRRFLVAAAILCAGLAAGPGFAQVDPPGDGGGGGTTDPRIDCTCETTPASACTPSGHRVRLTDFEIDQNAGESVWTYQVCNELGVIGSDCQPARLLDYISLGLPLIGDCLSEQQIISTVQVGGFDKAQVTCTNVLFDNVCGITGLFPEDNIAQCDVVAPSSLDPGECVDLELRISGEMPTLGAGFVLAIAKVDGSPDCSRTCVQGPSCNPCTPPPPPDVDECLTRTIGFWGTHPHISQLYAPVTVCGAVLNSVEAGQCNSLSEALCSSGQDTKNNAYRQLVAQLTAAKLNVAASNALDGSCGSEILERIAQCEALGCGGNKTAINASGCITDLTAFNESLDAIAATVAPFDRPGPANPEECQDARGNKMLPGIGSCAP